MKTLRVISVVSLSLGVVVAGVPACGGSDSSTTGGNDASTGSDGGAVTDGGNTNTDGSSGDSAVGARDGGSSTDGSSTTDGSPQGVNCPGAAPNNQSTCATGDGPCTYGNVVCDCGGNANPEWTCTTCPACPATQPTAMMTCMPGGAACAAVGTCTYGTTQCNCAAGVGMGGVMDTWACGECPGTKPTGTCTTLDLACDYGTTTCTCRRAAMGDDWECVTPPPACPTTQPSAGGSCTEGTGGIAGCSYGTSTCHCLASLGDGGDEWSCN